MTSTTCPRFAQNAWKKDLCSNCYRSKEEHKAAQKKDPKPSRFQPLKPNGDAPPPKGIIRSVTKKSQHKKHKLTFAKELAQVIGYGGEWSDLDSDYDDNDDDEHGLEATTGETASDASSKSAKSAEISKEIDEIEQELDKLTKVNTNYNQVNGNLLGDAETNIKRTFAAVQLGKSLKDDEGKKQTLKITVMPFGGPVTTNKVNDIKQKFSGPAASDETTKALPVVLKTIIKPGSSVEYVTETMNKKAPAPAEKSLLDEISETLSERKSQEQQLEQNNRIKLEIQQQQQQQTTINKRSLSRHSPNVKDQAKPKISVFNSKNSDSDSLPSDNETAGGSGYYDVVEASTRYENVSDDYLKSASATDSAGLEIRNKHDSSSFFSNHLISEMFSGSGGGNAGGKAGRNYNFMSQITSDGLIVTKASSSDDAMDSNGSSFDYATSSDEELSSMNRSESDSGIGICVMTTSTTTTASTVSTKTGPAVHKASNANNNTDYEDIQVQQPTDAVSAAATTKSYLHTKSREMAGEPDGSADPDGSSEAAPALPSSPPPSLQSGEPRISFLNSAAPPASPTSSSNSKPEKPAVPIKPTVSIIKAFVKRSPNQAEMISELQSKIKNDRPMLSLSQPHPDTASHAATNDGTLLTKSALKKSRAPDPPTPTAEDAPPMSPHYENVITAAHLKSAQDVETPATSTPTTAGMVDVHLDQQMQTPAPPKSNAVKTSDAVNLNDQYSFLYTRNPTGSVSKSTSPVIREKDKRERATINPKFRSLNTFSSQYKQQQQQQQQPARSTTPEPAPRKSLSMSQDCLAAGASGTAEDKKKKAKFSIKKFLRINTGGSSNSSNTGSGKSLDSTALEKKDFTIFGKRSTDDSGIHSNNATTDTNRISSATPQVKPRLVIIHPIDINHMEVEVVKEMAKVNEIVITGKPPAPPLRKGLDLAGKHHQPSRPPPPKSAEVRRKQLKLTDSPTASISSAASASKKDTVYANLGEIRSAIAPRKPERTASMREREAQLELARKRLSKFETEDDETTDAEYAASLLLTPQPPPPPSASAQSTLDRCELKMSTLESNKSARLSSIAAPTSLVSSSVLGDGIKSSIQKMNNTIDSYLKDRHHSTDAEPAATKVATSASKPLPPATPLRTVSSIGLMGSTLSIASVGNPVGQQQQQQLRNSVNSDTVELRSTYEPIVLNAQHHSGSQLQQQQQQQQQQRSSLPDQQCYQQLSVSKGGSPALARAPMGYCKSDIVGAGGRYQSQSMANIARAAPTARSYCGSEMSDFDIYSPYSFYSAAGGGGGGGGTACSETGLGGGPDALHAAGGDDTASLWSATTTGGGHQMKPRPTNRLRMRKGRSVMHKSLEDNYGAVVVANHEALAQVLEQLQKTTVIAPQLRPLANSINLRFDDFAILEGVRGVVSGRRAFHPAIWANQTHVTLALSVDCQQMSDLCAITEFCDLVPNHYLPLMPNPERQLVQATISVLPRMFVDTLQSFGQMLRIRSDNLKHHQAFGGSTINLSDQHHHQSSSHGTTSSSAMTHASGTGTLSSLRAGQSVQNLSTFHDYAQQHNDATAAATGSADQPPNAFQPLPGMPSFDDLLCREVGFVLLQLVNGLKSLQAKGIEELPLGLSNVILCRELEPNRDAQAKLCVLHGLNQDASRDEDEPLGTLCQCAHAALTQLLPATKLTPTLTRILVRDRSESLSKTKAVLEFALWGPVDVDLASATAGGGGREREQALQRWLDLERATVLHGLIRSRVELSVYDECHLMFLVRSSAKTMCEASSILSGIADSD